MLALETYFLEKPDSRFEKRLAQKLSILEKLFAKDTHPNILKVKTESINNSQHKVTLQLFIRRHTLQADRVADDQSKALELAFDIIKESLLQFLEKQREHSGTKITLRQKMELESALPSLTEDVSKEDRKAFETRLLPLLSSLKRYIRRRIRYAQLVGAIMPKAVQPSDLINEVIVQAYAQFDHRSPYQSFEQWLYQLADRIMDDQLAEASYEESQLESWEAYLEREIEEMDERLVIDAEGDVYLEDEFDSDLLDRTSQALEVPVGILSAEGIKSSKSYRKIMKVLSHIPSYDRSIFDLYALDGFTPLEIASIRHIKKQEVEKILEQVKNKVKREIK